MLLENHLKIPDSIFLDDVNNVIPTRDCHNNETQSHFNEDEQFSVVDTENLDELFGNLDEGMQLDAADDDVTVHSTPSYAVEEDN